MQTYRFLCWITILALLAPAAIADVTLTLKGNRKQLTGEIEKLEGDKVFIKTHKVRVGIQISQLTFASCGVVVDALLGKLDKKDPTGFLDLGDFCLRHKLWRRARRTYTQAKQIDSSYVTRSQAEQGIKLANRQEARSLYQAGVDHQAAGRTPAARKVFQNLVKRFPGSKYALLANKLLPLLKPSKKPPAKPKPQGKLKPPKQKKPAPKQQPPKKQVKIPKNPYLRYMQKLLAEVEQRRKLALREEGDGHHQKAIKHYEVGLKRLDTIKQVGDKLAHHKSPAIAEAAASLTAGLAKTRTRFYLALGHIHASVDQFRQATKYVNEVLIIDPEHKNALALRERITAERMRRVINLDKQGEGK